MNSTDRPLEKLTVSHLVNKFSAFYRTQEVHYRVHKSPQLHRILSQMSPIHVLKSFSVNNNRA
jgi:hypothetical protein